MSFNCDNPYYVATVILFDVHYNNFCCGDQHGCYRELSRRRQIEQIGLVICRMFSFKRIIVASSYWNV